MHNKIFALAALTLLTSSVYAMGMGGYGGGMMSSIDRQGFAPGYGMSYFWNRSQVTPFDYGTGPAMMGWQWGWNATPYANVTTWGYEPCYPYGWGGMGYGMMTPGMHGGMMGGYPYGMGYGFGAPWGYGFSSLTWIAAIVLAAAAAYLLGKRSKA